MAAQAPLPLEPSRWRSGLARAWAGLMRHRAKPAVTPWMEEYEPRLMYSADLAPFALLGSATPAPEIRVLDASGEFAVANDQFIVSGREVVFVDAAVEDKNIVLNQLLTNSSQQIEVIALEPGADGIAQISAALAGRSDIASLHIISHGADAELQLGNTTINAALLAARGSEIATWGNALSASSDILLYGCDVAASTEGQVFVQQIAALTGADVAASNDKTGHAGRGGDWDLEFRIGTLEAHLALGQEAQNEWFGELAIATLTAVKDTHVQSAAPDTNYGASTTLILDKAGSGLGNGHPLLQFDLSAIPSGATINSATLQMQATSISASTVLNVYQLTQAWNEGTGPGTGASGAASWNDRITGTPWTDAGGLPASAPIVSTLTTGAAGQHNWSITPLVQSWVNGIANHGLMLASTSLGTDDVVYSSREGATAPVLVVDYTAPLQVDTTNDVVDGNTSSVAGLLAGKGADGKISLREAIIATNNTAGADSISLGAGLYTLTLHGTNENAAAQGDLDITDHLTVSGAGAGLTFINGDANDRIFEVGNQSTVTFANLTLENGRIGNNELGSAIYSIAPNTLSANTITLDRVIVQNNVGGSGAIYNWNSVLNITDTTLQGNQADKWGGAIYNDGGAATLERVTISNNIAAVDGGGIYNSGVGATISLTNVTISGNQALGGLGGGLYSNRTATVLNATIAFNTAATGGGGIYEQSPGDVRMRNTILALNTGGNANTALTSLGNNIDSDGTAGLVFATDQSGTTGTPINVRLGTLRNNGGDTATHALQTGSPAINAGTTAGAPAVDQRDRPRDAQPDIGAYEVLPNAAAVANSDVYTIAAGQSINDSALLGGGLLPNDTDADGDTLFVTALDGVPFFLVSLPLSTALGTLSISASGSVFYSSTAGTGTDIFTYTVSDGTVSASGTLIINVVSAPTATNLNTAQSYTEDTPLNLTNIVISDADSANVTATLTLSNPTAGSLNTSTSGAVTSTYNAGTGVWTASGAVANVNTLLAGLIFAPAGDFNGAFSIATSVSDGVAAPLTGSKAITGTAVNDAPTATSLNAVETYTEDTALNLTDIVISDIDSATVTATLTLSNAAAGSLNTATSGAVTSTYNAGTGVWTANGALADVNTLLAGLTFTPVANFNSSFTIATAISDGIAPAITGSKAMTATPATTYYLEGDTTPPFSDLTTIAPIATTLVNFDPGRDSFAGLSLAKGGSGADETDNTKQHTWAVAGAVSIASAPVQLIFWSDVQDGMNLAQTSDLAFGKNATVNAFLMDLPTATTDSGGIVIATASVSDLTWGDGFAWEQKTIDFGNITYNVAAGRFLAVKLVVDNASADDLWIAYDTTTYNSRLQIGMSSTAPSVTNLSADETYVEDTAHNLTDIVVTDPDAGDTITATLMLSNTAAGSLNIATSGAVTSSYNAGSGVWMASGAIADVNTLLVGVTFTPAGNFNGNFSIATSVSDGVAPALVGSKAITGLAVNDALTASNLSAAETYTEDTALNLADIVISDIDSATVTATLTLSNTAAGSLNTATSGAVTSTYNAGTGVWSASGAIASVNTLLAGLTFTPAGNFNGNFSIATSVSDGVAPALTGSTAVTGTAVNDAPLNTVPGAQAAVEDTPLAINGLSINDLDAGGSVLQSQLTVASGTLNVSLAGGAGISAGANGSNTLTLSGSLTQINAALATLSYQGNADFSGVDTLQVLTNDLGNTGAGGALTDLDAVLISAIALNDAPLVIVPATPYSATEQSALNLKNSGIAVFDVDGALGVGTATLTVGQGTLNVTAGGSGAIVTGSGSNSVSISGNINQINNLLNIDLTSTVIYLNSLDNPAANTTLTVQINDGGNTGGGGALSSAASVAINISAVNDAPVNTVPGAQTVNEDAVLNIAGLSINDVDAAAAALTTQLSVSNGTLSANLAGGATISAGANSSSTLTLSGTQAQINAALATLSYQGNLNFSGTDSLQIVTNDLGSTGVGGALGDSDSVAIAVTAVNDGPVNAVPGAQTVNEDMLLAVAGVGVNDLDANLASTRLTVTSGALNVSVAGGAVISAGSNGGSTLTLSGTQAQINAALASLTYQGNLNFNGTDTLNVLSTDGTGATDSDNVAITVIARNDAPVNTVPGAQTANEDTALAISGLSINDVDSGGLSVSAQMTVANGTLNVSLGGGAAITAGANGSSTLTLSGSQAQINAALATVSYQGNPDFNGTDSLQIVASDLGNSGAGGTLIDTDTIAIMVNAENDAPTATNLNRAEIYIEDTPLNLTDIVASDMDSTTVIATLTLSSPAAGSLTTDSSGAITSTYNALTGVWTASGAIADVNTLLAGVSFNPTSHFNSGFTIAASVSDGVTAPITGSKAITGTAVNDAPVAMNTAVTLTNSAAYVVRPGDLGYSDVEGDDLAKIRITQLPGDGTLAIDGNPASLNQEVAAADIAAGRLQFVPRTGVPTPTTTAIGFQVNDGALYSVASYTISVQIPASQTEGPSQAVPNAPQTEQPAATPVTPAATQAAPAPTVPPSVDGGNAIEVVKRPYVDPLGPALPAAESASDAQNVRRASEFATLSPIRNAAFAPPAFQAGALLFANATTVSFDLSRPQTGSVSERTAAATANTAFIGELDKMRNSVKADEALEQNIIVSSVATGTAMSVGYVLWLLRGGLLLTSLMSSLPAWRFVDPLPVLGRLGDDDDDENDAGDDSLESMVSTAPGSADAQSGGADAHSARRQT